jgi:signal transduction histidine kinase
MARPPWVFDGVLAAAMVVLGAVELAVHDEVPVEAAVLVDLAIVPVAFRRVAPVRAGLAVAGTVLVASLWLGAWPDTFSVFAAILAVLFALGEARSSGGTLAVVALTLMAVGLDTPNVPDLAFPAAILGMAWGAGLVVGMHRRRTAQLHALAGRLERARETGVRLAVLEERARLATDIHDAVGHNVAAMLADARTAAELLSRNPDRARAALVNVQADGRAAIDQLRVTLRVLRSEPVALGPDPPDVIPVARPSRAWRWPAGAEAALVGGLTVLCLVEIIANPDPPDGSRGVSFALATLLLTGLAVRNRAPLAAATMIGTASVADDLSGGVWSDSLSVMVAMFLVLFALGAHPTLMRAVAGGLIGVCLLVADVMSGPEAQATEAPFAALLGAIPWAAGWLVRRHRQQAAELAELAQQLESERRANARLAVLAERAHIARELHDTVAHGVSVMVVQASAAEATAERDAPAAHASIASIALVGREALADLRRLLALFDLDEPPTPVVSPPTLTEINELVARTRRAGLPVTLRVEGTPGPVPVEIAASAYRIIQEALTNVLKHAGRAPTSVVVRYLSASLDVAVDDDGRRAGTAPSAGTGHGVIGMRERAALLGGELRAGPRAAGGYSVHARLPLDGSAR